MILTPSGTVNSSFLLSNHVLLAVSENLNLAVKKSSSSRSVYLPFTSTGVLPAKIVGADSRAVRLKP